MFSRRLLIQAALAASCNELLATYGPITKSAPTSAGVPAPTVTAVPVRTISPTSTPEYTVDNPPPVRNAPQARRLNGQKLRIYTVSGGNPLASQITDAIVERFTRDTGIAIEQLRRSILDTDTWAVYQTALEAQTSDVDVVTIKVTWPRVLAPHLVDLKPMLSAEASQHYSSIIQNNTVGNRLVGVPSFGDFGMLFYRTDLLEQYGFSAPPATWDELQQQARHIVDQDLVRRPEYLDRVDFLLEGYLTAADAHERIGDLAGARKKASDCRAQTTEERDGAAGGGGARWQLDSTLEK